MCEPATILAVAATTSALAAAGGAYMSYQNGQDQIEATSRAAYDNQVLQNQQLQAQRDEIAKQSANDMTERSRQAQIEQGHLRVISGESGALGLTQDKLLQDSSFQQGTDIATIEANRTSAMKQTDLTGLSNYNQNVSAINQAKNRAPTLLGTGLQIGGSLGSSYMGYRAATK